VPPSGRASATRTLSRLDVVSNLWVGMPNVVIEPLSNYLEVFLTDTGAFVVSVP